MAKKKDLSKGIRALLSNIEKKDSVKGNKETVEKKTTGINTIDINLIEANANQPRQEFREEALQELVDSIKIHGIIQPLTVRKLGGRKYQLISGERRYRASKIVGLKEVPVYIREANDQELLEMALIENIQREDLNAIEVAIAYSRLIQECKLSHEELATRVAKKRSTISNYLRLLKLPPEIQKAVVSQKISMGHARALAGVEDVSMQLTVFDKVIKNKLSVRALEALISPKSKPKKKTSTDTTLPTELVLIRQELKGKFGTSVSIDRSKVGKGKISIPFKNDAELNYILDILKE
jgi:ParB family chromosome partitioning protein